MPLKTKRKSNSGSGVRKARAQMKNPGRKSPVVKDFLGLLFIRHQASMRWPDAATEDAYAKLNRARPPRRKPGKKSIQPMEQGFTLLDGVVDQGHSLDVLLTAASLKIKRVRRYPGWVLQRVYNLKSRPIEII